MSKTSTPDALEAIEARLDRIAAAVELMAPQQAPETDFTVANAFVWQPATPALSPVRKVNKVDMSLLRGIDRMRDTLYDNTQRFSQAYPANNALLWGARGMGKSSLVKAVHAEVCQKSDNQLKLIEIHREDIESLPDLMTIVRQTEYRFIVFCDDLSFDNNDTSYKSLKAVLEGGIEGRPDNVIFYATSNRRHLLPRDMMENERSTAINPSEAVQEKVSLSDRFGLWLGFHNCAQPDYLEMVETYAAHFGLDVDPDKLKAMALEWSTTRGARSGRVAWQFIQDLAGQMSIRIST